MKLLSYCLVIGIVFCLGCTSTETVKISPNQMNSTISSQKITIDETFKIAMRQTIYVPIYSEIYNFDKTRTFQLSSTLSVRNTDPKNQIIITSVNYYNSNGKIIRKHLENPLALLPMASTDFVVPKNDQTGGSGANFLVEWIAEEKVYEPIIEAVMISTTSQQGISFISVGRVIENLSPDTNYSKEENNLRIDSQK